MDGLPPDRRAATFGGRALLAAALAFALWASPAGALADGSAPPSSSTPVAVASVDLVPERSGERRARSQLEDALRRASRFSLAAPDEARLWVRVRIVERRDECVVSLLVEDRRTQSLSASVRVRLVRRGRADAPLEQVAVRRAVALMAERLPTA